jgi:hypothetical protein
MNKTRDTLRIPWKSVALPAEHGGFGLLGEPVALGLVLAPSLAGLGLAIAAVAAFLARHPFRLMMLDLRKGVRYPRTALAERFLLGYLALAAAGLLAALASSASPFWPALAAAAPVGLVALAFDALGRSREAVAETAGAVALAGAATAIALAGGFPASLAWAAGGLLALRAIPSVLYVRARLRLDRGLGAGPGVAWLAHGVALVAAVVLSRQGWAPWIAVAVFATLLTRALWGLSRLRRRVRPQVVGFQELGFGLLTLVLLAIGFRGMGS